MHPQLYAVSNADAPVGLRRADLVTAPTLTMSVVSIILIVSGIVAAMPSLIIAAMIITLVASGLTMATMLRTVSEDHTPPADSE